MHNRTALIAGATGLIGQQLLHDLLQMPEYNQVIAITRPGSELNIKHDKLRRVELNFENLKDHQSELIADHIFCCLGTTMSKAGSKENFRKVDFEYPLKLAELSRTNGATQYHLVSALGADKNSRVFYNQVKGEIEQAIQKVNFDVLHIYRPSLLMGNRQESRPGEEAGQIFFNLFGFIFRGPLRKYKAIDSSKVAKAMLLYASTKDSSDSSKVIIHGSEELQEF